MKKKFIVIIISILLLSLIIVFGNIFMIKNIKVIFDKSPVITNENDIIKQSEIELNKNIFNLKENEIKQKIDNIYLDNTVDIVNVERKFPNEVDIYVVERKPILLVKYKDDENDFYIATDKDFQLTTKKTIDEINQNLIPVTGIYADKTFNKNEFRQVREIIEAFQFLSFEEEAILSFINEIKFSDGNFEVFLNTGNSKFELFTNNDKSIFYQTIECYNKFLKLSYIDRNSCIIFA